MQFIKDNYLRVSGSGDSFRFEVDPPKDRNIKFHDACISVAHEVYSKKQGKIHLMYSGGVDSEYILEVFLSLGMDITPVIVRLKPNYNEHDIKYAIDFCESRKLKPIIYDIDFDEFVKSGKIIEVAEASRCGAHPLPSTFHAVSQLDGTIVMGSHGPTHITKFEIPNDVGGIVNNRNIVLIDEEGTGGSILKPINIPVGDKWVVDEYEQLHSVLRHFENNKIYGCPFFLAHTAEQYYSFLMNPINRDLAENKYLGWQNNNFMKWKIFNDSSGFNMLERPKFTGYENIDKSDIFKHENVQWFETVGSKWHGHYGVNFSDMIRHLNDGNYTCLAR